MKKLSVLLLMLIFSVLTAKSQNDEHIHLKANPDKSTVAANEEFKVLLNVKLDYPWYTYSMKEQVSAEGIGPMPTEVFVEPEDMLMISGDIKAPETDTKYDEGFEMQIDYYKDEIQFVLTLKALQDIDFSKDSITVGLFAQLCDTARCLPPMSYTAYIDEEVVEITQGEIKAHKTESTKEIDKAKEGGVFSFLWFAMGAGALALLTPCVFPMIPITVSFFTKRAETHEGKGLRDSTIYALGIIITFTALGFILALLFGATGIRDFAANGWVNLFIAAIFIVFALNLFGAFEIQLPTGMMNKLNQKSQGSGIISVLLMGLTFSLTSFTCTVPFVGTALISASGGEWFYPIIGMLGFSAVFAAPFFLLALFPSAMKAMPKAGGWMNNVKVVMGFLEIAAAIKFISNADLVWGWGIMPREMFLSIWIAAGFLIVFYILGKYRFEHDSPINGINATRAVFATIFASITIWLATGLLDKPLGELDAFLPPPDYEMITGSTAVSDNLTKLAEKSEKMDFNDWHKDYAAALAEAKEKNMNLFIDFTGFTCTNCRWMETKMFPKPNVASRLDEYVKVKLFTDRNVEPYLSNKKMQEERYGSIELPLYVILTPDEQLISTNTFTRSEENFIEFLDKGINK
jgi:thiol:disulfide interchange protein